MEDGEGEKSSFVVVGLIENETKEVGVAAFDLRSASLHLSQFIENSSSYQKTNTLIYFYEPVVIIVPPNQFTPQGFGRVSKLVDSFHASVKRVVMSDSCFDDTKGAVLIKNLAAKEPSALGFDTCSKQHLLCLAAAAATIKWIKAEEGLIVTNHSLSVTFNGSFDRMIIDATSAQHLELIEPLHSPLRGGSNKKRSLFHMLKTTKTIGGTRLLRANLLQPLKDSETINARLDCLAELLSNEELFFGLSQVLQKFPKEIAKAKRNKKNWVLCHFCFKPNKGANEVSGVDSSRKCQMLLSDVILLKTALDALPLLSQVLKDAKSVLLTNIFKSVCKNEKYALIQKRIGEIIDEDMVRGRISFVVRKQLPFVVKAGVDDLLDTARRSFCDTTKAIQNLANDYRQDFKLPNLKPRFNSKDGCYFKIPRKDIQGKLPKQFIQGLEYKKNICCSTPELASLNIRNMSAFSDCYRRTELCLEALEDAIREDVSVLTLLAEVLCLLDMLVNSFAYAISTETVHRSTRPEFTDNGLMEICAGRHPILESTHNDHVPNDTLLSEASNMVIVMGPNMSGKSTYLQQVCLIVILAQIGCYVPARFSTLRVVDRLFTRMGNMESNYSTFLTEMREIALQNVSERSLIVIDELGRATSSSGDGFVIEWSCCEYLLSQKAYTIFATYMENLSDLATIYSNVKIFHVNVDDRNHLDFKASGEIEEDVENKTHLGAHVETDNKITDIPQDSDFVGIYVEPADGTTDSSKELKKFIVEEYKNIDNLRYRALRIIFTFIAVQAFVYSMFRFKRVRCKEAFGFTFAALAPIVGSIMFSFSTLILYLGHFELLAALERRLSIAEHRNSTGADTRCLCLRAHARMIRAILCSLSWILYVGLNVIVYKFIQTGFSRSVC